MRKIFPYIVGFFLSANAVFAAGPIPLTERDLKTPIITSELENKVLNFAGSETISSGTPAVRLYRKDKTFVTLNSLKHLGDFNVETEDKDENGKFTYGDTITIIPTGHKGYAFFTKVPGGFEEGISKNPLTGRYESASGNPDSNNKQILKLFKNYIIGKKYFSSKRR